MTKAIFLLAAFAPLVGLANLGDAPREDAARLAPAQPQAVLWRTAASSPLPRPAAYAACAVCHSDKRGERSGFGPNLFGVAGTRAGAVAGYSFSPAMKRADIVWDRKTLDRFIEAPQTVVPGTKMAFAGVKDPAKRKAIVDYLLALK